MNLEGKTRDQLRDIARAAGLTGYGKFGAGDLRDWLGKHLAKPTPTPEYAALMDEDLLDDKLPRKSFVNSVDHLNKWIAKANGKPAR